MIKVKFDGELKIKKEKDLQVGDVYYFSNRNFIYIKTKTGGAGLNGTTYTNPLMEDTDVVALDATMSVKEKTHE